MPMRRHRLAMALMEVPWLRPAIARFAGIVWPVFPRVESTWSLPFGVKDRGPQAIFRSIIRGADAFIDGGANLGWYSCLAAVAGVGEIIAVEPVPQTARLLKHMARWNHFARLRVLQCAMGDGRGTARFVVPDAPFPEMGHVGADGEGRARDVQVLGLADVLGMLAAERRRIVVKLDVEGHELTVVRGGVPGVFRDRIAGMMIEVHLGCFDEPVEALADLAGAIECIGSPMVMIPDDPGVGPLARFWRNATGRFPLRPAADEDVRRRVAAREIREVYLLARRAGG
ncbi:MAG: FkbM family methyltransferase [Verrucomicrobiae bacterium]|nr:FkbM family methyltransferase [Verrucomicrobiae bacterium]